MTTNEHPESKYHVNIMVMLAHPFRVFFLACAGYAIIGVGAWSGFLFGGFHLPINWSPLLWHSHEMLYGFVPAAIAGFLLTAMTNWTGAAPLRGRALAALVLLWFSGRLAMWLCGWLPGWLLAMLDLAFLPVTGLYATNVLLRYKNYRNLQIVAVLALLFSGNILMHLGVMLNRTDWQNLGQLLGFDAIALLIIVIAGRITPAFTGNWLRKNGNSNAAAKIRKLPWLEWLTLGSMTCLALADALQLSAPVIAPLALLAGIINVLRWSFWGGKTTLKEPLLWILHLSYLLLAAALLLRGAAGYTDNISASLWKHTLGVGSFGILILGVMSRVSVGHTGRALYLLPSGLAAYACLSFATLTRLLTATSVIAYIPGITLTAAAWMAAFSLFLYGYAPILTSPRADGRPG